MTTSYLSKLKNGKMPPPSFKMSIALALSLDVEPEILLSAGIQDNTKHNQEELIKALHDLHPERSEEEMEKAASKIVDSNEKVFTDGEKELIQEQKLTPESLKKKYNLVIDGNPATDEEIEKMIEYVKIYRLMKQQEGS
jgi:transcriptional regulator with XRE-family HTH domain